jgi:hypothetical protein
MEFHITVIARRSPPKADDDEANLVSAAMLAQVIE